MVSKNHPFYHLEKKRNSFLAIGMAISLFFVLTAMEWTTTSVRIVEPPIGPDIKDIEDIDIVITVPVEKKVEIPVQAPRPSPEPEPVIDSIIEPEPEPILPNIELLPYNPEPEYFQEPDGPFMIVEKMPQFGKGDKDLMNYLGNNIRYPEKARRARVEGIVYIQFVVNKKGEVTDPKVLRGIGAGCDKEALRVVSTMPKWKAGRQRGKRVPVQFTLPVKFVLKA